MCIYYIALHIINIYFKIPCFNKRLALYWKNDYEQVTNSHCSTANWSLGTMAPPKRLHAEISDDRIGGGFHDDDPLHFHDKQCLSPFVEE